MVLVSRHGLPIHVLIKRKFKRIDYFQICLMLRRNLETIHFAGFVDLNKTKENSTTSRKRETGKLNVKRLMNAMQFD